MGRIYPGLLRAFHHPYTSLRIVNVCVARAARNRKQFRPYWPAHPTSKKHKSESTGNFQFLIYADAYFLNFAPEDFSYMLSDIPDCRFCVAATHNQKCASPNTINISGTPAASLGFICGVMEYYWPWLLCASFDSCFVVRVLWNGFDHCCRVQDDTYVCSCRLSEDSFQRWEARKETGPVETFLQGGGEVLAGHAEAR